MEVKELKDGKVDEIELEITEIGDERNVNSRYGGGRVCDAVGNDETGSVSVSLWNDEIDAVSVGNKIRITNGWVREWNNVLQLSAGRYGKLEVVE